MTDPLEKVRGLPRELPIFPLPLVLFPGTPLPLHIFEPRYQQMLVDVRASGDNVFGVSYFDASESETDEPPAHHVGCVAEVVEAQTLPDGRSNIMTLGVARYRLESYVERGNAYLVGRVSFFEDEHDENEDALRETSRGVLDLFMRIARAVRALNDDRAQLPDLSQTDPERLSFLVAAAIELDAKNKQQLLEIQSTLERLTRIHDLLRGAVGSYEDRARLHQVAKSNGHSGKKVTFE
ncbi:MAG: LON peptidase substrate-binding domain-containing protein [Pyrinomonadaceae bacterium]